MIKINLLPTERKVVKQRFTFGSGSKLTAGAVVMLLLCAGFIAWRYQTIANDSTRLDSEISSAEQEVARLQSMLARLQQFEQRKGQLEQRVVLIEQLRSDQTGPVHMLDQISRALPPMVWLTDLKQTAVANEVIIAGRGTTLTGLSDFVGNLEASGYFKKSVEIISSTAEALPAPPGELVKFEIKGIFQQPGDAKRPADAAKAAPAGAAAVPLVKSGD